MPLIWDISITITIIVATIKLGFVPHVGITQDPYSLGLDCFSAIIVMLYLAAFVSAIAFVILTATSIDFSSQIDKIYKIAILIFLLGMTGVLIWIFPLTDLFSWVLD